MTTDQKMSWFDDMIKTAIGPNRDWAIYAKQIKDGETVRINMEYPKALSELLDEYVENWGKLYKHATSKRAIIIKFLAAHAPEIREELKKMQEDLTLLQKVR